MEFKIPDKSTVYHSFHGFAQMLKLIPVGHRQLPPLNPFKRRWSIIHKGQGLQIIKSVDVKVSDAE